MIAPDREALLRAAAAQLELKRRQEEEALRYYRPHKKQQEVHRSTHRVRGVLGGNRVGKTVVGAVETVLFALGPSAEPYVQSWPDKQKEWWYARFPSMPRRSREQIWAATVSWDVHRDVLQSEILRWLPKPEIETIAWRRKGVMDFIELKNGTRIVFKSYETGADGFQGASLLYVWLDEEPPYDVWNECEKRVMDRKGYILMTFTPLHGVTWSHDRVYLNTTNDPETRSWHFTWDDNPHLDEREKQRLLASMPQDEIEARVYGRYLLPGGAVFDGQTLVRIRTSLKPGKPTRVKLRVPGEDPRPSDLPIEVWEPPAPGARYVMGVDVAEGLPSGDNSVICVIRQKDAVQVAEFATNRLEPGEFALYVASVGHWYNKALAVVERNNDGKVVLYALRELGYPAVYRHRDDEQQGFPTNVKYRPLLISVGQEVVRDCPETIRSPALVEEMLTFVRNARGRPEAAGKGQRGGKKDDRVIAWCLAHWGRQFWGEPLTPVVGRVKRDPQTPEEWVAMDDDAKPQGGFARWNPSAWVRWPTSR